MFLREELGTDINGLSTLLKEREAGTDEVRAHPHEIEFHLNSADPTIKVLDKEYPATDTALQSFGDLLQIPSAFMKRTKDKVKGETLDALMTDLLANTLLKDARVVTRGEFIQDIEEWGRKALQPVQLVDAVGNALGTDARVTRLIDTPGSFGFDVRVPENSDKGVFGSGTARASDGREVDDITAGGVRVGLNIKQGLAPSIEEYLYRLVCTNGMTVADTGLKVDARGQTVDEVLRDVEEMAQIAFGRAERSIEHFYDLKTQRVENVERSLGAIAREQGLPDRSLVALMRLAAGEDLPDEPTMFDVVNLVTNFANSPQVRNDGGRLLLEGAGGAVVSDHATRCGHCQQKVR